MAVAPIDPGPAPPNDWALTGKSGGTGRAKLVSFLGSVKQRDDVGYDLAVHYRACAEHTAAMLRDVPPRVEEGLLDDADVVVVAFGTPGAYVRAAVRSLREEGHNVGWLRPVTLVPFPSDRGRRRRPAGQGRRRLREQHRPDGRRRPSGGPRSGTGGVHRRPEPGSLGFRHRAGPRGRLAAPAHSGRGGAARVSGPRRPPIVPTAGPPTRRPGWSTISPLRWSTSGPISCARGAASPSRSAA